MPVGGFEPQSNVHLSVIPIDAHLEQTPTQVECCLLICPDNAGFQLELVSITYRADTLPIDASNNVNVDIEFIDDSDSDTATNVVAAFELDGSGLTAVVGNELWRGSQILDAGDVINAEFDVSTPDTASEGAAFVVEYRVLRRS